MNKTAAVFLDRDGTINEEVGYLDHLEKFKMIPGTAEAIRRINVSGLKAVVVTNQSGIGRGFFSESFVREVHARLQEALKEKGAFIDAFYFCPHHPTEGKGAYLTSCDCRKPQPGLLLMAAEDLDLDLKRSYMVGDMPKDVETARKVGAKGILVKTGYGSQQAAEEVRPDYLAEDLLDAVNWILKDRQE
jgi:D-glycero-D-manno-heptose 1,7-bisphosphate phosphatase